MPARRARALTCHAHKCSERMMNAKARRRATPRGERAHPAEVRPPRGRNSGARARSKRPWGEREKPRVGGEERAFGYYGNGLGSTRRWLLGKVPAIPAQTVAVLGREPVTRRQAILEAPMLSPLAVPAPAEPMGHPASLPPERQRYGAAEPSLNLSTTYSGDIAPCVRGGASCSAPVGWSGNLCADNDQH